MLEFKYKDVFVGNQTSINGEYRYFYIVYGPFERQRQLWIFKSRKCYDIDYNNVYYLEDFFENLGKPTPTELSLFELNTGIRLII